MQVEIKVLAETETPEVLEDAVSIVATMMPFIFDNVVVTSRLVIDEINDQN